MKKQINVGDYVRTSNKLYQVTKVLKSRATIIEIDMETMEPTSNDPKQFILNTGKIVGAYSKVYVREFYEGGYYETPEVFIAALNAKRAAKEQRRDEEVRKWVEKLAQVRLANVDHLEIGEPLFRDLHMTKYVDAQGRECALFFTFKNAENVWGRDDYVRVEAHSYSADSWRDDANFGMHNPSGVFADNVYEGLLKIIAGSLW